MSSKAKKSTPAKAGILTDSNFVLRATEPKLLTAESESTVAEREATASVEPTKETSSFFSIQEVPIPPRAGKKGTLKYPIGDLQAGSTQSFLVPTVADKVGKVIASIRTFATRNDFKIIIRGEDTGVRVWRKA